MAIITSFINWKGGVGKTTLTYHVATGLAHLGKKVLLIDLDPQCNLSFLTGGHEAYVHKVYEQGTPTLKNLFDAYYDSQPMQPHEIILKQAVRSSRGMFYKNVDIVLSHMNLTPLDLDLDFYGTDALEKVSVIKYFLDQVADDYDHVLIDCPPNVSLVTQNALFASDCYVTPALPDYLSTVGITLIGKKMSQFNRHFAYLCEESALGQTYTETKFSGIIMNKVEEYGGVPKRAHQQFFSILEKYGDNMLFQNYLVDGTGVALAADEQLPVYAYTDFAKGNHNAQRQALCLEQITQEFLTRVTREARV